MELAKETLINAEGWHKFDQSTNKKQNQEHLDFAHTIARVFKSSDGKKVLDAMVKKYLLCDIANANDSQVGIGIKQGRADVVKYILSQIELSDKTN